MAIFTASAASDGAVAGSGGLLPVIRIVIAITIASESSQPKMKAAPFRTPRFARRMSMKAVSGSGSSVMTRPMRTRSRITRLSRHMRAPTYWARTLAFWASNSASVMAPRSLRSASFAN